MVDESMYIHDDLFFVHILKLYRYGAACQLTHLILELVPADHYAGSRTCSVEPPCKPGPNQAMW